MAKGYAPSWYYKNSNGSIQNSPATGGQYWQWGAILGLVLDDSNPAAFVAANDVAGKDMFLEGQGGGVISSGTTGLKSGDLTWTMGAPSDAKATSAADGGPGGTYSIIGATGGIGDGAGVGGVGTTIKIIPGVGGAGGTAGADGTFQVWHGAEAGTNFVEVFHNATGGFVKSGAGILALYSGAYNVILGTNIFYPGDTNTFTLGTSTNEWKSGYFGEDTTTGSVSVSGLYLGKGQEARLRWNKDATGYPANCLVLGLEAAGTAAKDCLALSSATITGFSNVTTDLPGEDTFIATQTAGTHSAANPRGANLAIELGTGTGTGVQGTLSVNGPVTMTPATAAAGLTITQAQAAQGLAITQTGAATALAVTSTLDAATGDQYAVDLAYTTNKATSGDDYGLRIVQTDTASPDTSYLFRALVGATPKVSFRNDGYSKFEGSFVGNNATHVLLETSHDPTGAISNNEYFKVAGNLSGTATMASGYIDIISGQTSITGYSIGTIPEINCFAARGVLWNSGADATITVYAGYRYETPNILAGFILTTEYGLNIGDLAGGATKYPIYQTGPNGTNYFGSTSDFTEIRSIAADSTLILQSHNFTGTDSAIEAATGTITNGNGTTFVGMMVKPTYAQGATTAAASDFVVSRTETSVGSGAQLLADFGTTTDGTYGSHTYKFTFSNAGVFTICDTGSIDAGTTTDDYFAIRAFDTGNAMQEVGRVSGGAIPYIALGGTQEYKFYQDGSSSIGGHLTFADAINVVTNATTGTMFGTAAAQKLSLWGVAPVIQPAAAAQGDQGAMTGLALTDNSGGGATDNTIGAIGIGGNVGQDIPDAIAELADEVNKIVSDVTALDTLLTAVRTALIASGNMKGAA